MKILFVCVENAGRSQMAEAFAKELGLSAMSAGTLPATAINPVVAAVMKEREIDISHSDFKGELEKDGRRLGVLG